LYSSTITSPENRHYAKELFTQLKPLKKKWASQASMTLTRDPELLKLAAESGCVSLFIEGGVSLFGKLEGSE